MRSEEEAVLETVPFQLLIIAVVLLITIPSLYFGLDYYMKSQLELDIREDLTWIRTIIEQVQSGGNNSSIPLTVKFENRPLARIEYIKLGDKIGGIYSYQARYKLIGQPERRYTISNWLPVTNETKSDSITLVEGRYRLVITHIIEFETEFHYIKLTVRKV